MPKRAVSVTLSAENLLWLRAQVRVAGVRSLSEILDRLVSKARAAGGVHERSIRSVVGTIAIADVDPGLSGADAALRSMFPGIAPRPSKSARMTQVSGRTARAGSARG